MFAYRVKSKAVWREFDLRPIAEVPVDIVTTGTEESRLWSVLQWGLMDPKQMDVLDHMPMRRILDMVEFWEKDSDITIDEIRSVTKTIEEHRGPLEADLIKDYHLRLRNCPSPEFNWRDLWIIITYADVNSNLIAAAHPDKYQWDRHAMLLADIADNTDWLVWAKTKAAQERGATPPLRRERPGVKNPEPRKGSKVKPSPVSKLRQIYKLDERRAKQQVNLLERQRTLESLFR